MTVAGWAQIVIFIALLTALTPLLGGYMANVYQGQRVALSPVLGPVERLTYLLSHEEPAVFVQMGNGRFEIITKYDLMGTIAGLMEQKR